jgi:tRNA dimethylallyltransferase
LSQITVTDDRRGTDMRGRQVSKEKVVLLVVGPTATGKTGFAIRLAQHFGTAIVSADSRQVYREMRIGTATPTVEELAAAPHYLVGHRSVTSHYNVSVYEHEALNVLADLFSRHDLVVVVGGSGMYCKVLEHGIDHLPDISPEVRRKLAEEYAERGLSWLQQEVATVDPGYFAVVDQRNPARLLRALEIARTTGEKFSALRVSRKVSRPFRFIKIGLDRPREELHLRIAQRVQLMVTQGLAEECRNLHGFKNNSALQSVGYREMFHWLDGHCTFGEAVDKITTNTRRYARRQMTWFRRDHEIAWFHPDNYETCLEHIQSRLTEIRKPRDNDHRD